MRRTALVILAAAVLGIVQASFVRALPGAASSMDLPLIMVVALVTAFRLGDAVAAALAAGIAADALSSTPFGTFTVILLALAAVTAVLFTRVFTHHTWLGTVGINIAVFALSGALIAVVRAGRAVFAGFPALASAASGADLGGAFAALGWQLAAVALALVAAGFARRSFSRFFFLRRDA